ncbi:MAG: BlaI/MecI/CopY family transcriptional regulator [Saccharofermentanales bacterium]
MEPIRLFDSELRLMELLWENEPVSAKKLSALAGESIGWNKNTTYTVLKKLVAKDVVVRTEPGFICTSVVKKEDVQRTETKSLIEKLYGGSKKAFFAAFLENEELDNDEVRELKKLIEKW